MTTNIGAATLKSNPGSVGGVATVGDYFALLKPRVMSLSVFTALVGMLAAPGSMHPVIAFAAILSIAVGAGASGALNMWYDADIDGVMSRTALRPIPRGRVTPDEALTFGVVLAVLAVMTLGLLVNWTAGLLLALTIGFYVFVYTMWLKRRTPYNIVIGGAAGAFPPMIGWAAQTGTVGLESIALFLIIFIWTPPHFWALSLYRMRDYSRAEVPMLPVVAGADETRWQILIYTVVLAPLGCAPWMLGFSGPVFGVVAAGLGLWMLWHAYKVFMLGDGRAGEDAARQLFRASLVYLFSMFAVLLAERLVAALIGSSGMGL